MAAPEKQGKNETPEVSEAPPPKKRNLMKIVIILLPILAIAGGGGWYFMQKKAAGKADKAAKIAPAKPPVFVPLDMFTVNLRGEEQPQQYLQLGLTLKVTDTKTVDAIKLNTPDIRNRILLLLSAKSPAEISTVEGKKALSTEIEGEVKQSLAGTQTETDIGGVLYTSFVIQ